MQGKAGSAKLDEGRVGWTVDWTKGRDEDGARGIRGTNVPLSQAVLQLQLWPCSGQSKLHSGCVQRVF